MAGKRRERREGAIGWGTQQNHKPSKSPILIFKSRQAPLTFIRAWYSALPTEFRAVHRYTPPSLICGLVTFMWLTVVPSDMVYWLVRCPLSRGMGSSSSAQVTVGGGAPLAAHIRENCSPGLTTFSLKEETMRGVPSGGTQGEGGQGAAATAAAVTHQQDGFELPPGVGALVGTRAGPCQHTSREMPRGALLMGTDIGSRGHLVWQSPSPVQTSSHLDQRGDIQ